MSRPPTSASPPGGPTSRSTIATEHAPRRGGVRDRLSSPAGRWIALFASTRAIATTTATGLLLLHRVTDHDVPLAGLAIAYGLGSVVVIARSPRLQRSAVVWAADGAATLGLVVAAGQWRSPFYLLALTALVLPATTLPFRRALGYGAAFTIAYLVVAIITGIDWNATETTPRLESLTTHLMVPMIVVLALAYAAQLLDRLERERERSEGLAIAAERRRIAWELHDSAKQRIHAAHLILSALQRSRADETLDQAIGELRSAVDDMDNSLADLRSPLLGERGLDTALRERARELGPATSARIEVRGESDTLSPALAGHAFRIASEALTNAIRHAEAAHIWVTIAQSAERLEIVVSDDGRGLPEDIRAGSGGLRSMRDRAEAIGGDLRVGARAGGAGTSVVLSVPVLSMETSP